MKTTLVIIVMIAGIILLAGCANMNNSAQTIEVVVIRDVTDSMIAIPKSDEIISQFNLDKEMWNGGKFRMVDLTDVSYNRIHEASIESENQLLSNKFQRTDKVKKFYSQISKIISDASQDEIGKDNSSVYFPIAKELNKLSQSSSSKKILLVYSDLMENTDEMSFYDQVKLDLIKANPDSAKRYFDSQMKLKSLNGIKIFLIYQPLNMKDDGVYKIVSNFYKALFESKGANVEITAGIN